MSDARGKDSSFLRKVAKFVSSPNTEWGGFEEAAGSSSAGPGAGTGTQERSELQVMVERKRRNDFVRRQEFDLLRQIRREGLTGEQIRAIQREHGDETSGYQPTEQGALPASEVRRRIDGIEREMSYEDTVVNTRALALQPADRPSGGPRATTATAPATAPMAAGSDQTRPGSLRRLGAQVTLPKIDLEFDTTPKPGSMRRASNPAPLLGQGPASDPVSGISPSQAAAWLPMLDLDPAKKELTHDPDLDPAAIAFANADFGGCEKMLRGMVARGGPRERHAPTWRALLDLYRAIGQQQRFVWTVATFVKEFGEHAPAWVSIPRLAMNMDGRQGQESGASVHRPEAQSSNGAQPLAGSTTAVQPWTCPARLDASVVELMGRHVEQAQTVAVIDWAPLQMLDAQGAAALRTLLRQWAAQPIKLQWKGVDAVFDLLEIAAPAGDHLADPAFWQVRLEALRLLGVSGAYDVAAEDFAATFGTVPPEWYPPLATVFTEDGQVPGLMSSAPDFAVSTLPDELGLESTITVELVGQLAGDVSATMARALSEIADATTVTLSCARLIRVDLMAAGELLNWVSARRAEGRLVRLIDVHRLVALFFCAMGLDDHAPINLLN